MGVEYAIVCDKTKEAYDLGKSFGWQWSYDGDLPSSLQEVMDYAHEFWEDRGECDNVWLDALAKEVWGFIYDHPGCRVISDTGDCWWGKPGSHLFDKYGGTADEHIYLEIGSRYDIKVSK